MSQLFDEAIQFTDETTGQLLIGGFLYIGVAGLDAKLNPKTIYPDRELQGTPLANPQVIGSDGRATNKIWLSGTYSFKVEDSANVQKYSEIQNGFEEQVGNTKLINALGINDVTVTGSPTVTTLVDQQTYIYTQPADNTGAMTLKIDTLLAKSIRKGHDQVMAAGDIKASQKIVVVYNLTDDWFEIQSNVLSSVFSGGLTVGDSVSVDGVIDSTSGITGSIHTDGGIGVSKNAVVLGDIVLPEKADHSSTPSAGNGYLWVKNDTPNSLVYTDDAGTDRFLINRVNISPPSTPDINDVGTAVVNWTTANIASLNGTGAKTAIIRFYSSVSDDLAQQNLFFNDSGLTGVPANSSQYRVSTISSQSATSSARDSGEFTVPLDSNQDFQYAIWRSGLTASGVIQIRVVGYYL